jgi:alpha-ketoglutarate-dependent taurine dioxygenase
VWASGYEVYDRISVPIQRFLETLSVTFEQPEFGKVATKLNQELYTKPRGAVENVGPELKAQHPVVRTNPITGWKSIFPIGAHVRSIDDVSEDESKWLLDWFLSLIHKNHDVQVRFRWLNPNDIGKFSSTWTQRKRIY